MNGKRRLRPSRAGPLSVERARDVAALCLGRLAADEERLERFLSLTGLSPGTVRDAAREPGFPAAVLDHVLSDEDLLMTVADEIAVPPEAIGAARDALGPPSHEFG